MVYAVSCNAIAENSSSELHDNIILKAFSNEIMWSLFSEYALMLPENSIDDRDEIFWEQISKLLVLCN